MKPAGFGTVESGVYGARFRQVFGRALECPTVCLEGSTGGADADAQLLGDDRAGEGCWCLQGEEVMSESQRASVAADQAHLLKSLGRRSK